MSWLGWTIAAVCLGTALLSPFIAYLFVKLCTFAWYRGRELFYQSRREKQNGYEEKEV